MKKLLKLSLIILLSVLFTNFASAQNPVASFSTDGSLCASSQSQFIDYSYDLGANNIISWRWDFGDGNTSTQQSPTNIYIAGGSYTVSLIVNNDIGGTDTTSQIIFISKVNVSISTTNIVCFGYCDGVATVIASGGVQPYTYLWDDQLLQTTQSATELCAGIYNVTVTDSMGCNQSTSVVIHQPAQFSLSVSGDNVCGECNGTATASVFGGTPPYSFYWSNGYMSPYIEGLCAGYYRLTATDAFGCHLTDVINILNVPNSIDSIDIESTPVFCDNNLGSALVSEVHTGTPPYIYYWSNGAIGQTITNLRAGFYTVTVSDAIGCTGTAFINVLDSSRFTINLDSIQHNNCANNQMGYISVHADGGQGPFTYLWSPGGETSSSISNLLPGVYSGDITDMSNSCMISETYIILNNYNLYASVTSLNANCTNNGSATVNVQGINPPFTYSWDDSLAQTDSIAINLNAGIYHVTITDANGCTIIATANIIFNCDNIIQGTVYVDQNQNCIQDNGELPYIGAIVRALPSNYYAITDSLGHYTLSTPEMSNNVEITNLSLYFHDLCPVNGVNTINFSVLGDTATNVDFAVYVDSLIFDLDIHPGWTQGHPGFEKEYWFFYKNTGTETVDAVVNFVYDELLQYNYCTQGGVHDALNHTITWYFPNLAPGIFWNLPNRPEAYFTLPATASISDSLETYFEMLPTTDDIYPLNNTLFVNEPITGSHDPNDKKVYPTGTGVEGCILPEDSVLFYTIRFQNDGNDTAFTVVVIDTLSPNLNLATLVPGSASHPYTLNISEHGILEFHFDQIMLPDSSTNLIESQGYFNYSIRLQPELPWNTVITNNAAIYFDFNPPVITNTVVNTICEPLFIPKDRIKESIIIYPNPTTDKISIEADNIEKIEIMNIEGRKIYIGKEKVIDISQESNGIYIVKVITDKKIKTQKLIKQ